MEGMKSIVQQQAEEVLQQLSAQNAATPAEIAESVLQRVIYWERSLPDGDRLLFVRLFSPVVMREEVFLGNILFNDFLSKAFVRAVEQTGSRIGLIANDLENYYFLVRTRAGLHELAESFRAEVERSLPELFFDEPDPAQGIYGSVETMLDFNKANVEPFPVFIMPQSYKARLERAVRESLLRKIAKSQMDRNPSSIMANLAFFYSHDGTEMQSPYLFLVRLALKYGIVSADDLWRALNLDPQEIANDETTAKKAAEEALKQKNNRAFSASDLRVVLKKAVFDLGAKIDSGSTDWLMPYISSKFLPISEQELVERLLATTQLGHILFQPATRSATINCRVCGIQVPEAEDKSILMGQSTHRFHNQSSKQKGAEGPKACFRCATFTYLIVKLLGSEAVGQPQVPKTYNLIFHYGKHTDKEIDNLARSIDRVWELVRKHREAEQVRRTVMEEQRKLKEKMERARQKERQAELEAELEQKGTELKQAEDAVIQIEKDIFASCPWMRDIGASPVPYENPALDVLGNLQLSESKVERHVLGLGMGGYRMILFILPQIRQPRDEERDFAQSRFSNSWITITAFLSFLNHLCGCNGPFYYQSLPTLTPEAFQPGTFFVRNRAIRAEDVQRKYAAIYDLAWQLVWQRGPKGFVKKVMLAEKLLADPLGTFSAVMRDSPILGQQKGGYKRLGTVYRPDWGTQDLTEYVRFIQQLAEL